MFLLRKGKIQAIIDKYKLTDGKIIQDLEEILCGLLLSTCGLAMAESERYLPY